MLTCHSFRAIYSLKLCRLYHIKMYVSTFIS
nr:MAG TPA: hypothetical protein [Caudoviricetes sp.]